MISITKGGGSREEELGGGGYIENVYYTVIALSIHTHKYKHYKFTNISNLWIRGQSVLSYICTQTQANVNTATLLSAELLDLQYSPLLSYTFLVLLITLSHLPFLPLSLSLTLYCTYLFLL